VANKDQKLFPGMTANVSIRVAEQRSALLVPNAALRYTPPAETAYETMPPSRVERAERIVYQAGGDGRSLRPVVVNVGITDGLMTVITAGLAEGAPVVTATVASGTRRGVSFTPPRPPPQ
jgi:HlyD family secretion protein